MKILYFAIGAIYAAVIIAIRFANPELTETELFLKFWPVWVIPSIILILGIVRKK